MKKIAITALKYTISLSILAWLFWKAATDNPEVFADLRDQPKNWPLVMLALGFCLAAVTATIVRWWILVRTLAMPFTLPEALRLGFVGFLFNFLTLGVVGGDLVKAIFLARRQKGRRTEAVATIVIDRMIGLYALFLVAAISILCVDLTNIDARNPAELAAVKTLCWITVGAAIAGTIGIILVALPSFGRSPLHEMLERLPKIGPTIHRVTEAVRIYRSRPALMAGIGVMSLGIHVLFVASVFSMACGLPGQIPSLAKHFVIVPIANVANTLPLPGGMGAFEYALDFLYRGLSSREVAPRQGFVIALGYRIATLVVALIGVVYYLTDRQEISELIKEAQREEESKDTIGEEPLVEIPLDDASQQQPAATNRD